MTHEDKFLAELRRLGKEPSRALPAHKYSDPAKSVKLQTEGRAMDRIRELLREWAAWHRDREGAGYPNQSPFATERVQNSNRDTETYRYMPDEIVKLDREVERLAPPFKQILRLEYFDKGPQKAKAASLQISREVFSIRLRFAHEQLSFVMFGK